MFIALFVTVKIKERVVLRGLRVGWELGNLQSFQRVVPEIDEMLCSPCVGQCLALSKCSIKERS